MRMEVNMCYLECVCVHACMHVHLVRVQLFTTPFTVAFQAPCPWNFPGKNTRVGCVFLLLLGIFLTQESNPCLFPVLTGRFFTTELSGEPKKPLCSPKIMKNFKVQFYLLDTSDSEKSEWPDCMRNNWCADWSQKTGTIFQPGKNFQTSLMDFLFYYSLGFRSKKIVECQP